MITGVHHLGLSAADLSAASAMFSAAVEFSPAATFPVADDEAVRTLFQLSGVSADVVMARAPNIHVELFRFASPAPKPGRARGPHEAGIAHVCFQSPKAEASYAALEAAGVRFLSPLTGLGGPFRYAYGHGPDGLLIELEEAPCPAPGGPDAWIGHVAFATPDLERLANFYAGLTGLDVIPGPRLRRMAAVDAITGLTGADMRAAWVQGLNIGLEFWRYATPETAAVEPRPVNDIGYSHVCFESDDIDADFARAEALGARAHAPPQTLGRARVAYLRDPDGNVLELLQWLSATASLSVARLPHRDVIARFEAARGAAA